MMMELQIFIKCYIAALFFPWGFEASAWDDDSDSFLDNLDYYDVSDIPEDENPLLLVFIAMFGDDDND
jgi:hypothetical protein